VPNLDRPENVDAMSTPIPLADRLSRIANIRAFALKAKLPRRTLYNVMRGTHKPTARTLERIEKALAKHRPEMR
jgi:predicted transcriptional regulator